MERMQRVGGVKTDISLHELRKLRDELGPEKYLSPAIQKEFYANKADYKTMLKKTPTKR